MESAHNSQGAVRPRVAAPEAGAHANLRVIHVLSSLQVGGLEHFVLRTARRQNLRGERATILALRDGPLRETALREGLEVKVLAGRSRAVRVLRALHYFMRERPQVAHAHNETCLQYAVLAKQLTRARAVLTYHGQGSGCYRVPTPRERRLTDAVVAVSEGASRQLVAPEVREKLRVVYNGVEPAHPRRPRAEVRAELGLQDRLVGIVVARMDGLKGHDTLLRALAQLPTPSPLTMLAAGDGKQRPQLEALGGELGLREDRFRMLGFRNDVPDLLAAADFFVLPSLTEGLPLSVLEAMAHGLPVIATPVGGVPELIPDERFGLLVPVNDPPALAAALRHLAAAPQQRASLGEAGRRRVQELFSMDRMLDEYDALYRLLVSRAPGSIRRGSLP